MHGVKKGRKYVRNASDTADCGKKIGGWNYRPCIALLNNGPTVNTIWFRMVSEKGLHLIHGIAE